MFPVPHPLALFIIALLVIWTPLSITPLRSAHINYKPTRYEFHNLISENWIPAIIAISFQTCMDGIDIANIIQECGIFFCLFKQSILTIIIFGRRQDWLLLSLWAFSQVWRLDKVWITNNPTIQCNVSQNTMQWLINNLTIHVLIDNGNIWNTIIHI